MPQSGATAEQSKTEGISTMRRRSARSCSPRALALLRHAARGAGQRRSRERLLSVTGEGMVHGRARHRADHARRRQRGATAARGARREQPSDEPHPRRRSRTAAWRRATCRRPGFSVEPVYSQPPRDYDGSQPFTPEIVGYRVSNNLTLRIRDLTRVGAILDQVVTLGANSISGPTFTVADPTPLETRRAAPRCAMRCARARSMPKRPASTLGPIFRIEEGYASARRSRWRAA